MASPTPPTTPTPPQPLGGPSFSSAVQDAGSGSNPIQDIGPKLERNEVRHELVERLLDDWDAENIKKLKKYEATYARRLRAKYFSNRSANGVHMFDQETIIDDMVIRSSRWPCTRSFADLVKNIEDQSRVSSLIALETSLATKNNHQLSTC